MKYFELGWVSYTEKCITLQQVANLTLWDGYDFIAGFNAAVHRACLPKGWLI